MSLESQVKEPELIAVGSKVQGRGWSWRFDWDTHWDTFWNLTQRCSALHTGRCTSNHAHF